MRVEHKENIPVDTSMSMLPISSLRPRADELAALREAVARVAASRGPVLPFGVGPLDHLLAGGGLDGAGLHEVAGASASWDRQGIARDVRGCAARWLACLRHRRGKGGGPDGDTAAAARGIRGQHAHAALPSLSALRPMSTRRSVARDDPLAHWNAAVGAPRITGRRARALVGRARPPARRAAFLPRTGGVR